MKGENVSIKKRILIAAIALSVIICLLSIIADWHSIADKLFFILFIALCTFTAIVFIDKKLFVYRKTLQILWMVFLLSCNYATNVFNSKNIMYKDFQWDSESLVTDMIDAKNDGIKNTGVYGLGHYNSETKNISLYSSQYGLQGKIFQYFHKIPLKHIACCLCTAIILCIICLLIKKKYNRLLSFCFFITFWLSPWIVNFARNLYWVEFTWFIPMLIGVLISLNYESMKIVSISLFGIFISVLVKSLCGYEYLSVILLAMIAIPAVDFFESLIQHDYKKSFSIFLIIFFMGVFAILGFSIALVIHANLRGDGNIIFGLKKIYENDVLRRTLGGKIENFDPVYKDSLEASIPSVISKYYNFYTEIISGISGKNFTMISLLPIFIFAFSFVIRKIIIKDVALYFIFYVTCISWFVLGKSHSYIHTHMNYVLWYFGFIQMCFYVILKQIIESVKYVAKFAVEKHSVIKDKIMGKIYD